MKKYPLSFSLILISIFLVGIKLINNHSIDKFISKSLSKDPERIIYIILVLVGSYLTNHLWEMLEGMILLVSLLGIGVWNYKSMQHYVAAFSLAGILIYMIFSKAQDLLDHLLLGCVIGLVTMLVLGGIEVWEAIQKVGDGDVRELVRSIIGDGFISRCEHFAIGLAIIYFIKWEVVQSTYRVTTKCEARTE